VDNINFFSENSDVKSRRIILRLDLNVPIKEKRIQDETRISLCLPFIRNLILKGAKVIIISHLGRPKGKSVPELSLSPIYKYLKQKLDTNVYFFMGDIDDSIKDKFSYQKDGEVILFENIRFFRGEEDNDEKFSKKLAALCDIYINDAFSCSHRKQASIHKITNFVKKSFAGPLLKRELEAINLVIKNKKKPVTCIIGGSKISSKINVINNLIKEVDNLIIVGAMANNFLALNGFEIGKSLVEENTNEIIKKIYNEAKINNCEITIPQDCKVSVEMSGKAENKNLNQIKKDEMILDIGSKTIDEIYNKIENSGTILWNGPAGYIENENFKHGTISIAKKISDNTKNKSLISILGGGDTLSAINNSKEKLSFTHLSTAGGAFLEYLEGKDLPGLSVLK
tara:strand:- start:1597 stop:2787 length:1191 start_codon:yes stop_codon:yes gene_type:complete